VGELSRFVRPSSGQDDESYRGTARDAPSPGIDPPREQVYCQRGDLENRIKESDDGMQIGRAAPIRAARKKGQL